LRAEASGLSLRPPHQIWWNMVWASRPQSGLLKILARSNSSTTGSIMAKTESVSASS